MTPIPDMVDNPRLILWLKKRLSRDVTWYLSIGCCVSSICLTILPVCEDTLNEKFLYSPEKKTIYQLDNSFSNKLFFYKVYQYFKTSSFLQVYWCSRIWFVFHPGKWIECELDLFMTLYCLVVHKPLNHVYCMIYWSAILIQ